MTKQHQIHQQLLSSLQEAFRDGNESGTLDNKEALVLVICRNNVKHLRRGNFIAPWWPLLMSAEAKKLANQLTDKTQQRVRALTYDLRMLTNETPTNSEERRVVSRR